jgi:hypothetical protein
VIYLFSEKETKMQPTKFEVHHTELVKRATALASLVADMPDGERNEKIHSILELVFALGLIGALARTCSVPEEFLLQWLGGAPPFPNDKDIRAAMARRVIQVVSELYKNIPSESEKPTLRAAG